MQSEPGCKEGRAGHARQRVIPMAATLRPTDTSWTNRARHVDAATLRRRVEPCPVGGVRPRGQPNTSWSDRDVYTVRGFSLLIGQRMRIYL